MFHGSSDPVNAARSSREARHFNLPSNPVTITAVTPLTPFILTDLLLIARRTCLHWVYLKTDLIPPVSCLAR